MTIVFYAIPSLAVFVVPRDYTGQTELTVMIPLAVHPGGARSGDLRRRAVGARGYPGRVHRDVGFPPVRRYLQVQLPIAVPAISAGLRVAVGEHLPGQPRRLIGNQGVATRSPTPKSTVVPN